MKKKSPKKVNPTRYDALKKNVYNPEIARKHFENVGSYNWNELMGRLTDFERNLFGRIVNSVKPPLSIAVQKKILKGLGL